MNIKLINFCILFCFTSFLFSVVNYDRNAYEINIERNLNINSLYDEYLKQYKQGTKLNNNEGLREKAKQISLQVYEKEQEHPDFVHCVTSQDSIFYSYQVVVKELYSRIYGEGRKDFEFLRVPSPNLSTSPQELLQKFPTLNLDLNLIRYKDSHTVPPEDYNEYIKENEKKLEFSVERFLEGFFQHFYTKNNKIFFDDPYLLYKNLRKFDQNKIYQDDEDEDDDEDSFDGIDRFDEFSELYNINDTIAEISKEVLSVSFSLENWSAYDSAMFVFLLNRSVAFSEDKAEYHQRIKDIFKEAFELLQLSDEIKDSFIERLIAKAPLTPLGIINQIFLPKENVKDFLYLSYPFGFYHPYNSDFERVLEDFHNNRLQEDFRIFRSFQARIVVGSLFLDERVKIFRHTLISEEEQKEYEHFVKEVFDEIFELIDNS